MTWWVRITHSSCSCLFSLPRGLQTPEHFGLYHNHVTLSHHMLAAQGSMPFSDALLASICNKHETEKALQSALTIASPAPSTTAGQPLPTSPARLAPLSRLTKVELEVLTEMRKTDAVMRRVIREEQWEIAATRWNTFVVQYEAASGRMRLHPVHGDMIKKAVALLDNQADRRLEHSFIKRAEERAAKDLDAVIPYVPVSPMTQPFSLFEEQSLREMVRTCSNPKTGVVKWQKLTTRWMCFYQASVEANAHTRLTPRSDEHLRSRWSVLKRRDKHATKEEPVEAAAADGKEEMEEEKEKAEDAQQDDDVGQDDDAESATAGMEESTAMETEQHTPAPPSQSPSTSVTPFYILGRWLTPRQAPSPPSLPPLPPLPVTPSSSSSWSSSSSILTTTAPDGPTVEPQQQQRKKWHWPEPEAQRFRELAAKSGYKWSYDEFCAQWPLELFDHVAEARFDNKNKTELKKLRTGSSTNRKRTRLAVNEDSSSSSKGARKVKQGRPHRTAKLA